MNPKLNFKYPDKTHRGATEKRRRQCAHRGRDGTDTAASHGTCAVMGSWMDSSLKPLKGAQLCGHLDFGLLASRTMGE